MANIVVGIAAVEVTYDPENILAIQNLGPGIVYIDTDPAVTTSSGFKLIVGATYETPRQTDQGSGPFYVISDTAATDVRTLEV